ncbi:outer membrane protein assembly factor BamB family protein [Streptomyces sp. NBC_01257]|uniref:outer membrane protein assembly factor BamB family protein n=1 Tax=Streptomyces sp. NBC_01257 TaxID=2903799 RepID=UPI002DD870EF|nr:PQQ-binding-like beta-propeller repeat protein [Streptomyces sp. NBC_01257]WRZ67323.1 PQQ-binding-like beta-propeller repeat protein [Streptomyces sp. NBC_01257]
MEALRQDDPRRFGPYTVLVRFRETAAAVQYLARGADPDDLVVVTAARPALAAVPAFRRRFQSEARTADRLAGGWVAARLDSRTDGSGDDDPLWTASAYVPSLTLAEAVDIAGPLPERAVRILGAGIAETLSRVHATGAVLQGLAPRTVLVAEDGPRLTAFGPLGAAADAEARPGGQLSVRLGYLTPEQVAGKEAGPASDLFVLGLLLAYAATGSTPLADGPADEAAERIAHTDPRLDDVPEALRELVARCLAKDPAERPAAGAVAAELALEGAAGLAKGGWLPAPLASAVAQQDARARMLASAPPADLAEPADVQDAAPPVAVTESDGTQDSQDIQDTPPAAVDAPAASLVKAPPADAFSDNAPEPSATHGPDEAPAPPAPAAPARDTRTAQLGIVDPHAPRPDRVTAQLAMPQQLPGSGPGIPAAPQTPHALPSAGPAAPLPSATPPPPAAARTARVDRRALLIGAAAGVAGLLVGGGGVAALGGDDAPVEDPKPAPEPSRPTVAGLPPQPRWIYTQPDTEPAPLTAALWNERLLVLTGETQASAVDLNTGRRLWESPDAAKGQAALPAGKEFCFVAGPSEFLWLSAKDGRVAHRVAYADGFEGAPHLTLRTLVGSSGAHIWFTGSHQVTVKAPKPKKGKKPGKDRQVVKSYLFGYDIEQRKELWRTPVPSGRGPIAPVYRLVAIRQDAFVVRQEPLTLTPADVKAAKGKALFRSFDRTTGKQQWIKAFGTVTPDGAASGDAEGVLYAAVGDDLRAFETPGGKPKWTLNGTPGSVFGPSVEADDILHTSNRNQEVGAVDRATGRLVWRRSTEAAANGSAPRVTLSGSGGTLLAAGPAQVTAFAAADGRRLWKFQDIGAQDPKGATVTASYQVLAYGKTAIVRRGRVVYAFPVA